MEKNAILRHILVLEQPGSLLPAQGTVIFLLNHVGSGGLSGDLFLPTQTTQSCKPVEILISLESVMTSDVNQTYTFICIYLGKTLSEPSQPAKTDSGVSWFLCHSSVLLHRRVHWLCLCSHLWMPSNWRARALTCFWHTPSA